MEKSKKTIHLTEVKIQPHYYIGLKYPGYNAKLVGLCKRLGMQWSKTLAMWLIPQNKTNYFQLRTLLNGHFPINDSSLKRKYLKRQIQNQKTDHSIQLNSNAKKAIERFKAYLATKRYSEHTQQSYLSLLSVFFSYYNDRHPNKITVDDFYAFNENFIMNNRYSISYQRQLVSAIKLYYKTVPGKPIDLSKLVRPSKSRTIPKVLSRKEVIQMISAQTNLKHKTIIMTLYGTGIRVGEMLNLKIEDIDSDEGSIKILNGKGRKDRNVPLGAELLKLLRKYYRAYRPVYYLFEGFPGKAYSRSSVNAVLKKTAEKVGIEKNVSAHTMRHSFATHLLEKGTNLRYIQELLGHRSAQTTQIYTYIKPDFFRNLEMPSEDIDDEIL